MSPFGSRYPDRPDSQLPFQALQSVLPSFFAATGCCATVLHPYISFLDSLRHSSTIGITNIPAKTEIKLNVQNKKGPN